MSLARRDRDALLSEMFPRGVFDWPLRILDAPRILAEDEIRVEEYVEGGELVVKAELPGIDPDRDVDVSIQDGNLCIRAEHRHEEETTDRDYRRSELRYGSFSRVLPLPAKASESDITARYHDGILEIRAPLRQESERSRIHVSRD